MALDGERNDDSQLEKANQPQKTVVRIEDEYSLYAVRNAVLGRAEILGMGTRDRDELEIIVRELVTNVLSHGGGKGFVEISHNLESDHLILSLDVVDRGPGFINFRDALRDGYSSTGSMGVGLPSVRRLAEQVKLVSTSSAGSHIRVSKRFNVAPKLKDNWTFSLQSRPHPGETESGDQGTLIRNQDGILLVLADGLGHGIKAAEASRKTVEIVQSNHRLPLQDLVLLIDDTLKKTRGAAVSLARLKANTQMVEWVGVGNVSGSLIRRGLDGTIQQQVFANFNGTLGAMRGNFKILEYAWQVGDWIMLATDGLQRNWHEEGIEMLSWQPNKLSRHLVTKAARERDDCSVLVGKSQL